MVEGDGVVDVAVVGVDGAAGVAAVSVALADAVGQGGGDEVFEDGVGLVEDAGLGVKDVEADAGVAAFEEFLAEPVEAGVGAGDELDAVG